VTARILAYTEAVCGADTNIVDKPIVLNIFSYSSPNLTLVDLPGITRVAKKG